VIGIDHYGASAPGAEIMKNFGFTAEHVTSAALRLMGRNEDASKEYGGDTTNVAPTAGPEGHS
jgi:transketolase